MNSRIRVSNLALAALALLVGFAASQTASAAIIASGSFTFNPTTGAVTVNTGDITLGTTSKTEPPLAITSASGNLGLVFTTGTAVVLSPNPVPIAPDLTTAAINETMTIAGQVFTFTSEQTLVRLATTASTAGTILEQYSGSLTSSAGDIFVIGAPATWSETCTQVRPGAGIDCANSVITVGQPVPEPASLAIFGTALAGLGLLRRRRPKTV